MNHLQKIPVRKIGLLMLSLVVTIGLLLTWLPGMALGEGETPLVYAKSGSVASLHLIGPSEVAPGESFEGQIQVSNVEDLYGAAVQLTFDPEQLQVVDADPSVEGVQITRGEVLDGDTAAVIENEADNRLGHIRLTVTRLGPVSGITVNEEERLTLATVSFEVQEVVTAGDTLTILPVEEAVQLADSQNQPIPFSFTEYVGIVKSTDEGSGSGGDGGGSRDDDDDNDDDGRPSREEELMPFADLQGVDPDIIADIRALSEAGIMTGYVRNGTRVFEPWQTAKRAQVAKVIAGALGLEPDAEAAAKFHDVVAQVRDETDRGWVGTLARSGIANGYEDGNFGPYDEVTRQQLASFFIRALGLEEVARELYENGIISLGFRDVSLIDPSHAANVALAVEIGFLQGREGGTVFDPRETAFRSHLAKFGNQLYSEAEAFQAAAEALLAEQSGS